MPPLSPADAPAVLHQGLVQALAGLQAGHWPLQLGPPGDLAQRGPGHFHLVPELFLQLAGHTRFRLPQGDLTLGPGRALLLPPRLLHAEQVAPGDDGRPFANLVLQADGPRLGCHLAHEASPGRPGILHLQTWLHPQAAAVHDWLAEAARCGPVGHLPAPAAAPAPWAAMQARALVCAAVAGVLRALADPPPEPAAAEPALVARLRVLVQNQLGDAHLSVRGLAAQSGCTPDHLSHVFARSTGEHLVAHISRLRMARAARLLRETGMAGKQVAWACGYASHSYFSHHFRQHHGMTPQAWRAGAAVAAAVAAPGSAPPA